MKEITWFQQPKIDSIITPNCCIPDSYGGDTCPLDHSCGIQRCAIDDVCVIQICGVQA